MAICRSRLLVGTLLGVALFACGSGQRFAAFDDGGAPSGAPEPDAAAHVEASGRSRPAPERDPGDGGDPEVDGGRAPRPSPSRGTPPDPGPYTCGTTARTVGAHRTALPSIVWSGAGYTIVMDEVVVESSFTLQLTVEKTNGAGQRIAGPTPITPNDGTSRLWPRVAFSGWEYAVTFLEGAQRQAKLMLVDRSLAPIAGSTVTLTQGTAHAAGVAWSDALSEWGVTYGDASGVWFQRFDAQAKPRGAATLLASGTFISESGHPIVATATGWAVLTVGGPAGVYEIDDANNVRTVSLSIPSGRGSLAVDGNEYGVVHDDSVGGKFIRIAVGGGALGAPVPFGASSAGVSTPKAQIPDIARASGGGFIVTWAESVSGHPRPIKHAKLAQGAAALGAAPYSTQTNAGFHALATGPCGSAVTYGTFSSSAFSYLDVRP